MKLFFSSKMSNRLVILLFLIIPYSIHGNDLPPYASKFVCHQSWANFSTCIVQNANDGLKALKGGIPELGIAPIDPMHIDYYVVNGAYPGIVIGMVMENITIYGQGDVNISRLVIDTKRKKVEIDFDIPKARQTCDYVSVGLLFTIPINSAAHFDGNFTDIRINLKFSYIRITRNGTDYYKALTMNYHGRIGSAHVKLTSFDPKAQRSANRVQNFFNNHDRLVLDTVYPIKKKYSQKYYLDLVNSYLDNIPADEILPP